MLSCPMSQGSWKKWQNVTNFKHPEDPQSGFLTIMAVEAVKEKKDLIVWESYWMCNLGTIFKGMNPRKDLNTR